MHRNVGFWMIFAFGTGRQLYRNVNCSNFPLEQECDCATKLIFLKFDFGTKSNIHKNMDFAILSSEQEGECAESDFGPFSRDGPRVVADRGQGPGANRMSRRA